MWTRKMGDFKHWLFLVKIWLFLGLAMNILVVFMSQDGKLERCTTSIRHQFLLQNGDRFVTPQRLFWQHYNTRHNDAMPSVHAIKT